MFFGNWIIFMAIFSPKTIAFLQGLKENNNKPWFTDHEADYRQHVLAPLVSLVETLSETMLDIDGEFETRPAINKTIARIYRDTRFSKDKTPFRTNPWISFKRPVAGWQDMPGYYFEVADDHYGYGMGLYQAERLTMEAFRARLAAKPDEFRRAVRFVEKRPDIAVGGDLYKKTLNPDIPADLQSWYQRKSFYLFCTCPIDDRLFDEGFAEFLAAEFKLMAPLYQYIWTLK